MGVGAIGGGGSNWWGWEQLVGAGTNGGGLENVACGYCEEQFRRIDK